MNDLVDKGKKKKQIWTKKKYAIFISIMSRPKTEKIVYLRLVNLEQNNNNKKKENLF